MLPFSLWLYFLPVFVGPATPLTASSVTTFVGSTPTEAAIMAQLGLPFQEELEFIKWKLDLDTLGHTFYLHIQYGATQPNTMGFKNGGFHKEYRGTYSTKSQAAGNMEGMAYQLAGGTQLKLLQLSPNLLHFLTDADGLMASTGSGWAYTLSAQQPVQNKSYSLPVYQALPTQVVDQATVVFAGRTPAQPLGEDYGYPFAKSIFKLKWKLTLYRDPQTGAPLRYTLKSNRNNREHLLEGKWQIGKGLKNQPGAAFLQLDPDQPAQSLKWLIADEKVLFLLDKEEQLYVGNQDFAFTLNRME